SPSWPTPWRRRAARTRTSWGTCAGRGRTSAAAGHSTACWGRSDLVTEDQWNSCTDPWSMVEFLLGRASERRLRLFAVACCRRGTHLMTDPRHRAAVEAA